MSNAPAFAFIGCGNMGMAVLRGALQRGVLNAATTMVVEASAERRHAAAALGVNVSERVTDAAPVQRILLAVKPQVFEGVGKELGGGSASGGSASSAAAASASRLVISVMAGWSARSIGALLGTQRIVRTMPNIAAQIGAGMTAIAPADGVSTADVQFVEQLFSAIGQTVRVPEDLIDAATAVSSSGLAYVFLLAEAKARAAQQLGFDEATARALVAHTLTGAAALLSQDGASAAELRAAVTSKGGTTEAALRVFEERGFTDTVTKAMTAARDRGRELGR